VSAKQPRTLAIDIGGTGLKASVLDLAGRMLVDRVRTPTPDPCTPEILLRALDELVEALPPFERISVGFPGVVRRGKILTAPHFDRASWTDFPLEEAVAHQFGKPARLLNDAEVQGLGIIKGRGLEVVVTFGTGLGSAIFRDGALMPHLELAHHPVHGGKTYNEYVGDAALERHGVRKWNRRVLKVITILESLLHYDVLYLGGGNAAHIEAAFADNIHVASNDAGITGGIHLWDRK
jgi:polyphosphate glucokinase